MTFNRNAQKNSRTRTTMRTTSSISSLRWQRTLPFSTISACRPTRLSFDLCAWWC